MLYLETDIPAGYYASSLHLAKTIHAKLIAKLYEIQGSLKVEDKIIPPEECFFVEIDETDGLISLSSKYFRMELVFFKQLLYLPETLGFDYDANGKYRK